MKFDAKTLVAPAAVGAAGGTGLYVLAGGGIKWGAGTPVSSSGLAGAGQTTDRRRQAVSGGALAWDPRLEAEAEAEYERTGHYWIVSPFGRRYKVDSHDGAAAAYQWVDEQRSVMNEWGRLAGARLTPEQTATIWRSGARAADLSSLAPSQLAIMGHLVNAAVQFANGLRVLARIYRLNRMPVTVRPRSAGQGHDLSRIVFDGFWNPLAGSTSSGPTPRGIAHENPAQWEGTAFRLLAGLSERFPSIMDLSDAQAGSLSEDVRRYAEGERNMGALTLLPFLLKLAVVIVAGGVAIVVVDKLISVFANWLGINIAYQRALLAQYQTAMEQCQDADLSAEERQAACELADTLSERIEAYDNRIVSVLVAVGLGVGLFVATYFGIRWWRRGKVLTRTRSRPRLPA